MQIITRSQSGDTAFDWRGCCFICGETVIPNVGVNGPWRSQVLIVNQGRPRTQEYYRLYMTKSDVAMIRRLNGELVAIETRYHRKRNCLSTYINPRNVAVQKKSAKHNTQSMQ